MLCFRALLTSSHFTDMVPSPPFCVLGWYPSCSFSPSPPCFFPNHHSHCSSLTLLICLCISHDSLIKLLYVSILLVVLSEPKLMHPTGIVYIQERMDALVGHTLCFEEYMVNHLPPGTVSSVLRIKQK